MKNEKHNEIEIFLARNIRNINYDKGLTNELNDPMMHFFELMIGIHKNAEEAFEKKFQAIRNFNEKI